MSGKRCDEMTYELCVGGCTQPTGFFQLLEIIIVCHPYSGEVLSHKNMLVDWEVPYIGFGPAQHRIPIPQLGLVLSNLFATSTSCGSGTQRRCLYNPSSGCDRLTLPCRSWW